MIVLRNKQKIASTSKIEMTSISFDEKKRIVKVKTSTTGNKIVELTLSFPKHVKHSSPTIALRTSRAIL